MVDWTRGYLQARFRGVPFFIRGAAYNTGRRNVKHVYPRRDTVDHEDMGQADRDFDLDAYVLGDNYFDQRKDLEAALNVGGTGVLIHPYRGVFVVVVNKYGETERTGKGRVADFKISFSIQDTLALTASAPDTKRRVKKAKKNLLDKILEAFDKLYNASQGALATLQEARDTLGKVLSVMDKAKALVSTVAEFKRELENFKGDIIALSLNAKSLVTSMERICQFGTDTNNTPGGSGLNSGNALANVNEQWKIYNASTEPASSITDPAYPANQINALMGLQATAALVGATSFVPYESVQDAQAAQDELFDLLDTQMKDPSIPDIIFEALQEAKAALYDDFQARSVNLPLMIDVELAQGTDVLSLSYEMYGTISAAEDIANRNSLIHPGFVPANKPLQLRVVSDE